MKPKVYIDGKEGTTGLQIYDRLSGRDDIELLLIDEEETQGHRGAPQVFECGRYCVLVLAGCCGKGSRFVDRK